MSEEKWIPKVRFEKFNKNMAWEKFRLGELVTIKSGTSPSAFKFGEELYVKVDDLNYSFKNQRDTNMKVAENLRYKKIKKGSVIFPKRGAAIMTNKVRIMGISGYMDTNMMALEPEGISTEFLYLFISKTGLYKIADTSTIPQINNKHIEPYKIIMPEENEQQKIGNLFGKLDQAISLQQQVLETTKEYKQSMLQKMFPKKGEKVPEIRFKEFDSKWDSISLNDIAELKHGYAFKSKDYTKNGAYSILTIKNVTGNRYINSKEVNFLTKIPKNLQKHQKLKSGDLLISLTGNVGRVSIVNSNNHLLNQRVGLLEILNADEEFVFQVLNKPNFENAMINRGQGAAQLNISKADVENYPILIPSFEEQQKIGSFFKTLDEKIEQEEKKLETYQSMKKALMQRMFV